MRYAAYLLGLWVLIVARPAVALTQIDLQSDAGDYVGQGLSFTLTPADGAITVGVANQTVSTVFRAPQGSPSPKTNWYLSLAPASARSMQIGTYGFARRFPSAGTPAVDVSGDLRGCLDTKGRFTVYEYVLDSQAT